MESIESVQIKDANPAVQEFLAEHVGEYFYCEREHCIMRKTACLQYQKESEQVAISWGNQHFFGGKSTLACERSNCWDCEQGERIKKEVLGVSIEKQCSVEGCTETKLKARGMCKRHYNHWYNKERAKTGKKLSERGIDGRKARKIVVPENQDSKIIVDFENYPELLDKINEAARDDMRPVEMQVLYFLRKGLINGTA